MASILVVDDFKPMRNALTRALGMAGHDVSTAADGPEALRFVAARTFDLVILDYMMPDMNGLEVLKRFRQLPGTAHLPLVVYTAYNDPKLRDAVLAAGATDCWFKCTFGYDYLASAVNKLTRLTSAEVQLLQLAT